MQITTGENATQTNVIAPKTAFLSVALLIICCFMYFIGHKKTSSVYIRCYKKSTFCNKISLLLQFVQDICDKTSNDSYLMHLLLYV